MIETQTKWNWCVSLTLVCYFSTQIGHQMLAFVLYLYWNTRIWLTHIFVLWAPWVTIFEINDHHWIRKQRHGIKPRTHIWAYCMYCICVVECWVVFTLFSCLSLEWKKDHSSFLHSSAVIAFRLRPLPQFCVALSSYKLNAANIIIGMA